MTTTWSNFELPKLPSGVSDAANSFTSVLDTLTTTLKVFQSVLQMLSATEIANLSATQVAIKAATDAISSAIQSLKQDAGVYILFVPPRKRLVVSSVVEAALKRVGMSLKEFLATAQKVGLDATLAGDDTELRRYFEEVAGASGGNPGFLRTVFDSLNDEGDVNRPQLSPTDAIYGACVVAGSSDYAQLLNFLLAFKTLFGTNQPGAEMLPSQFPVPEGVTARATLDGVFVEWVHSPGLVELPALDLSVAVRRATVIRSRSAKLLGVTNVADVFGTVTLSKGLKAGAGDDAVEVVAVLEGSQNTYLDVSATDRVPFYYAVSYHWTTGSMLELLAGLGDERGFVRLSNVAKANPLNALGSSLSAKGVPPDWIRTPSVAAVIPDLARLLGRLESAVAQFSGATTGYGDMLKKYLEYLGTEITKYEELATDLGGTIRRLTSMLDTDMNVGMYAKQIEGVGGTDFLKTDLAAAFAPSSIDPQRPPFDRGDEFVGGLVVIVTAPTAAALAPAKALLSQLLLSSSAAGSAVTVALEQIDAVLDAAEREILGDAMLPTSRPVLGEADPGNCPKVRPASVFGDDFKTQE